MLGYFTLMYVRVHVPEDSKMWDNQMIQNMTFLDIQYSQPN